MGPPVTGGPGSLFAKYSKRRRGWLSVRFSRNVDCMPTSHAAPRTLLSALPADLIEHLFANARPVRLAAGSTLFVAGDPATGCYRVDKGLLKVSVLSGSRGERILAIAGPGEIVGEISMLDEGPRSAGVAAVKDSELSFVTCAQFRSFAEDHPEVYKQLVRLLTLRLRYNTATIAAGTFLSLKGRVARALLDLSAAFGHDVGNGRVLVRQKITQSDLAAMAGIARENVSRILSEWKRQSVVSRLAGYYCLENPQILERDAAS
jgi:CRP/FNR family transcriptional regulator, cyclic AMP receptor protein